ncbi:unnamed protein product [Fusarium graminearum]|nr:unnamed protein product [Fusarium graminearum]
MFLIVCIECLATEPTTLLALRDNPLLWCPRRQTSTISETTNHSILRPKRLGTSLAPSTTATRPSTMRQLPSATASGFSPILERLLSSRRRRPRSPRLRSSLHRPKPPLRRRRLP